MDTNRNAKPGELFQSARHVFKDAHALRGHHEVITDLVTVRIEVAEHADVVGVFFLHEVLSTPAQTFSILGKVSLPANSLMLSWSICRRTITSMYSEGSRACATCWPTF